MKALLLATALGACSEGWTDVPGAPVRAVGDDAWRVEVALAVDAWAAAVAPCPAPFVLADTGHDVEQVPLTDWPHGSASGMYHPDRWRRRGLIEIRARTHADPQVRHEESQRMLLHELGHAIGLGDTLERTSIMSSAPVVVISEADAARARALLGCAP